MNNPQHVQLWNDYYDGLKDAYLFPNEYVVRTFLSQYPNLNMEQNYEGAKICDVSCGDGRNMVLLNRLGAEIYGTEITDEICEITRNKLLSHPEKIDAEICKGYNWDLPFEDEFFDYLLSWNACYYMKDEKSDIQDHINEFARVLKPGGYMVLSIISTKCFSMIGREELGNNIVRVNNDNKGSYLNGSIYHAFPDYEYVEEVFGTRFHNFSKAKLQDDCYGLPMDYFIFTCQKK